MRTWKDNKFSLLSPNSEVIHKREKPKSRQNTRIPNIKKYLCFQNRNNNNKYYLILWFTLFQKFILFPLLIKSCDISIWLYRNLNLYLYMSTGEWGLQGTIKSLQWIRNYAFRYDAISFSWTIFGGHLLAHRYQWRQLQCLLYKKSFKWTIWWSSE